MGRPGVYITRIFHDEMARRQQGNRDSIWWRELKYDLIILAEERGRSSGKSDAEIFGKAKTTKERMALLDDARLYFEKTTGISLEDLGIDAAPAGEAFGVGDAFGINGRIAFSADVPLEHPTVLIVEKRTVAPRLATELRRYGIQVLTSSGGAKKAHIVAVQRWRAAGVPVLLLSDEDVGGWTSLKSLENVGGQWIHLADLERASGQMVGPAQIIEDTSFTRQSSPDKRFPPELIARLRVYGARAGTASGVGRVEMEGQRTAFGGYPGYARAIAKTIREMVGDVDYGASVAEQITADPDFIFGGLIRRLREATFARVRKSHRKIMAPAGTDPATLSLRVRADLEKHIPAPVRRAFDLIETWLREGP